MEAKYPPWLEMSLICLFLSSFPWADLVGSVQPYYDSDYEMMEGMDAAHPVETIRKYFPETWIWDIVSVK